MVNPKHSENTVKLICLYLRNHNLSPDQKITIIKMVQPYNEQLKTILIGQCPDSAANSGEMNNR